jgi:1,3-propanediol dehydrogenase
VVNLNNIFLMPSKILSGIGAINQLEPHIRNKGDKALIVSDSIMTKIGNVERLSSILNKCGISYEVYDEVDSEPTDLVVEKGVLVFQQTNCKFIIALGGGSPIDAAKAIGFMTVSSGKISNYMGEVINTEIPYLVAIPTTAGTGSEVTQFTIITDTENNVKMLLKGPALMPKLAVVDPDFTVTTPPTVTVATGIDALTHAIEAYTSKRAQPLSDVFALSAIKRIYDNLEAVFKNGQDMLARYEMSLGALEAGIAFNNSSVTIVHGMSRPIGAIFHVPHGVSNAILLAKCLEFAIEGHVTRFAEIAKTIGIYKETMTELEAAQELVCVIDRFCKVLQVPTLEELKIDRDEFYQSLDKMAEDALESGSPANAFRNFSKKEIIEIYIKLWE